MVTAENSSARRFVPVVTLYVIHCVNKLLCEKVNIVYSGGRGGLGVCRLLRIGD